MHAGMLWASLPCELLVDILGRPEATAVVRCAAACKPWRRAIIANASSLHPYPDRFNPNLLVGFFYPSYLDPLQYVPAGAGALFQDFDGSLLPAAGIDVDQYDLPLSSRDGFLLLCRGYESSEVSDLCL